MIKMRPSLNFNLLMNKNKQVIINGVKMVQSCVTTKRYNFLKWYTTISFIWITKKSNIALENTASNPIISKLQNADKLFENGHFEECHRTLLECDKEGPDVEVQWRICRVMYNMSKDATADRTTKKHLIMEAYQIINELLQKNKEHCSIHKWYAILLDAKSSYDGTKERIQQSESVKRHMDLAVAINPKDATALHMLGEWCYQVTELPWHQRKIAEALFAAPPRSSYEDALEYFLRAEAVEPRFYSLNLLRIGNCYLKLNKPDQAEYYLKLAASYPAKSNDDHKANKEAADLLKKLNK